VGGFSDYNVCSVPVVFESLNAYVLIIKTRDTQRPRRRRCWPALLFCVFIRIPNFYECELMSGKQQRSRLRAFIVKSGLLPGQK
jgi:hypothetical protein